MNRFHGLTAAFLMIVLASCGGADGGITGGGGGGGGGGGRSNSVTVANNSFTPAIDTVTKGTTVTWSWAAGSSLHTVTFDDGITSDTTATGSYARTFDATGTFPYHCKVHGASMSGSVTVQ